MLVAEIWAAFILPLQPSPCWGPLYWERKSGQVAGLDRARLPRKDMPWGHLRHAAAGGGGAWARRDGGPGKQRRGAGWVLRRAELRVPVQSCPE